MTEQVELDICRYYGVDACRCTPELLEKLIRALPQRSG